MSTPSSYNPYINTPDPDSPTANQWWSGLSFHQQEFISYHYNMPIGKSPYTVLLAYRNRTVLRSLPGWPETCFTQI